VPLTAYAPVGDPDINHHQHRESRRFTRDLPPGEYGYAQNVFGEVLILLQEHQPGHAQRSAPGS
jgi:hypothetical protein